MALPADTLQRVQALEATAGRLVAAVERRAAIQAAGVTVAALVRARNGDPARVRRDLVSTLEAMEPAAAEARALDGALYRAALRR